MSLLSVAGGGSGPGEGERGCRGRVGRGSSPVACELSPALI